MMPVRADLELRLVLGGDRSATVPVRLGYRPSDPWAVTAVFRTGDGDVTWVFGRELLEEGLAGPTGEGDVAVWPVSTPRGRLLYLSLASPSGSALLEADPESVRDFLDRTYTLVPVGTEASLLDLDAELAKLVEDLA
ncbi:MAG: SsgA family sporulation/cell division regulator [Candidatus Nanopelagicales bacterium]